MSSAGSNPNINSEVYQTSQQYSLGTDEVVTQTRRKGRPPTYTLSSPRYVPVNQTGTSYTASQYVNPSTTLHSTSNTLISRVHCSVSDSTQGSSSTPDFHQTRLNPGRPVTYSFLNDEVINLQQSHIRNNENSINDVQSNKFKGISADYIDVGDAIYVCTACKARLWKAEALHGNKSFISKMYSLCCLHGKVVLPNLIPPPEYLLDLYRGQSAKSKNFVDNVRWYNMMFSFTSMDGKIDHNVNSGRGPYVYQMHGQNYHLAGSLIPEEGETPKYYQLYIYDTANESQNTINAYNGGRSVNSSSNPYAIEFTTVHELQGLLDAINLLVKKFRMARDKFAMNEMEPIQIKLIGSPDKDGRTHNLPTADEVAAIIVGDIDGTADKRDIILEKRSRKFRRISEFHIRYLALQYPLLFPYAEDGYRTYVYYRDIDVLSEPGHNKLTIREFFSYRLQARVGEMSLILLSRKLLQQFIVDAYTMVENKCLNYIRNNQKILRVTPYDNLYDAQESGHQEVSDIGNRVILPASFTGGARFLAEDSLNPEDRPDIVCRVFKIKLDALMHKFKREKTFGKLLRGYNFRSEVYHTLTFAYSWTKKTRYVDPYNKELMKQFQAHMNVEWCNQIGSIKYLFKYISKGPDRISIAIQNSDAANSNQGESNSKDEIANYYSCRYLSACEASWHLFDFPILHRSPAVYMLQFHLPNHQPILYDADDYVDSVLSNPSVGTSQFIEWMRCNQIDENACQYTYVEFPRHYVWKKSTRKWTRRKEQRTIGRINFVPPKPGETYYLRILLNKVKGPTCFENIRTVNNQVHDSFKEACYALRLLDDDREYVASIKETYEVASDENELKKILYNLALAKIERLLNSSRNSLKNIQYMPFPDYEYIDYSCNMMIQDEISYDKETLVIEHATLFSTMTDEQKSVYNTVIEAVDKDEGGTFFHYGYGGTGKTFVWKILGAALRSRGDIIINVASSGIAALLLTGGRTAHSRFAIPNVLEDSFCNIQPDSPLAGLLNEAKLIIWDEAPMMHRHCVEAFERTMRDIIRSENSNKPFGGKVVVFGGDFCQILPVIPKGSRVEIVYASIYSSELWRECKVLKLTKNMRLLQCVADSDVNEIFEFAKWILDIGEGKINLPNDGEADVEFPEDVLLNSNKNPIKTIVNSAYPSIHEELENSNFFKERAILAPTNLEVDEINEFVLSTINQPETVFYSSDALRPHEVDDLVAQQLFSPKILNDLRVPGVLNHKLVLKIGVPIMLLRNVD
ncbi:uncharacterized protein [Rutidosis leptorrhynchoides]|uniref:uncharacterized protein n=1 Tax=Rutidosis leptorrhynchoides TaxID=125765 RepID=UPI003A9A5594